jgi:prefoldin subunit 5
MSESEGLAKLTEYLKQTRRQAEVAIDNLNGQIATLVQENEKLTNIIISLQQERDHFKSQLETLQQFNSNKAIFKERDDWRALVDSIQADRSRLQEENNVLQQSLQQANQAISELQKQTEYLQEEKAHLSTQILDLEGKLQTPSLQSAPASPHRTSESNGTATPFVLSPIHPKNGQQLQFFADSPRSIARQLKFELRKAYEQVSIIYYCYYYHLVEILRDLVGGGKKNCRL